MRGSAGKIQLASLDELFGVSRGENVGEPFKKSRFQTCTPSKTILSMSQTMKRCRNWLTA